MTYTKQCVICGASFTAATNNTKYCCNECRKRGDANKKKREREAKKAKRPKMSINKVIAFCVEYEKKTGRYLKYGDAVAMLEQGMRTGKAALYEGKSL